MLRAGRWWDQKESWQTRGLDLGHNPTLSTAHWGNWPVREQA